MNKLTLSNGWEKTDLIIQKNKIILGQNILQKYKIKQILKAYFNGADSEFRKENNIELTIKLDDEQLQLKRTGYFEVNDNYSITDDCKLGTKSILLKYFETILDDSILFDSINTIDILFESLVLLPSIISLEYDFFRLIQQNASRFVTINYFARI